jgi:hypothetical protein
MTEQAIPYKKTAKYTGKKSVSLTEKTYKMWSELSEVYKVEVADAVRPGIDEVVKSIYQKITGSDEPSA